MISTDWQKAAELLKNGEVVAIPTETVYGLAANAFDLKAVSKIFEVKNRPTFDPLIVHTDSWDKILTFTENVPDEALLLAEKFWAGAMTLLLPKKKNIPDLVTSGLPHVAVRIPDHPLTQKLLSHLPFPLAAPSANPFGYISPTTAQHVENQLGDKIPFVLDGGISKVGIESTIIGFEGGKVKIFRLGGISVETIEQCIGKVEIVPTSANPQASGMLATHYAPRKSLFIVDFSKIKIKFENSEAIGILRFIEKTEGVPTQYQQILSPTGNFLEATQNLFAAMHYLDNLPIDKIYAELLPEKELGRAINDRLRRASVKN